MARGCILFSQKASVIDVSQDSKNAFAVFFTKTQLKDFIVRNAESKFNLLLTVTSGIKMLS